MDALLNCHIVKTILFTALDDSLCGDTLRMCSESWQQHNRQIICASVEPHWPGPSGDLAVSCDHSLCRLTVVWTCQISCV